jgi:NAD(P)-dependent dehydrogenase (short-subunit alcohol dehydrogenase family)
MESILITGANRGIGFELTRLLIEDGRRVIATCRDPESASDLNALNASNLHIHQLEVTSTKSIEALKRALSRVQIDVLINNAGEMGSKRQRIDDMNIDAWRHTFDVNTIAPFQVSMALLDNLKLSLRPRIISVSSQMGALSRISSGALAYQSSKAALNKVMQVMAKDLESENIIVCSMHPGWVQTDMGGPSADISVNESAAGMISFFDNLTSEQSGRFWKWNGEEHAW